MTSAVVCKLLAPRLYHVHHWKLGGVYSQYSGDTDMVGVCVCVCPRTSLTLFHWTNFQHDPKER